MPQGRDIIVVGASAGGGQALTALVAGLPAGFDASVFIAMHLQPGQPSILSHILDQATPLPVTAARNGAAIEPGHIYVAPPDRQLLLEPGRMRVVRSLPNMRYRPQIDALFRSAARTYGRRVIGVVLTGMLDDGSAGLAEVKKHKGLAVVQDPADALYPDMPLSAMRHVSPNACLRLQRIPAKLVQLARNRRVRRRAAA